jgi:CpcD/allophycocyanin linker domain
MSASDVVDNTAKRFLIKVSNLYNAATCSRLGDIEYVVEYSQMSQIIKNIHRTGGKIISITEIN